MLSSAFLGRLSDRKGAHQILIYSLMGAALFSVPQAFITEIWQLILLRFLVGLCLGGLLPAANTLIRLHSAEGMESRTYGFSNSAMYLGNMIGPIIGGWFATSLGVRGVFLASAALLLINVFIVKNKVIPVARTNFFYAKSESSERSPLSKRRLFFVKVKVIEFGSFRTKAHHTP